MSQAVSARVSSVIGSQRVSWSIFLELYSLDLPVMFENMNDLQGWAVSNGLTVGPCGRASVNNIVTVSGHLRASGEMFMIWARADYDAYRGPFLTVHKNRDNKTRSDFADVDVDHVFNRARVRRINPDAWLVLMPVQFKSNRPMGSVEKGLPYQAPSTWGGCRFVKADAFSILKVFSADLKMPVDKPALKKSIRGHFSVSSNPALGPLLQDIDGLIDEHF